MYFRCVVHTLTQEHKCHYRETIVAAAIMNRVCSITVNFSGNSVAVLCTLGYDEVL